MPVQFDRINDHDRQMMAQMTLQFIAAGGNRHPSAADWAPGVLAFGAGNNIAIWNPDDETNVGITALLAGHTEAVSAVKILSSPTRRKIISGGADNSIRIWKATDATAAEYHESQCLTEHSASVNVLATLSESRLLASGAADGTVKIWSLEDDQAKLVQTISLKPRYFPLALALTSLPSGDIVLAVAGTSTIIQLYVKAAGGVEFGLQATLSGHEGWVRSLDFTRESVATNSDILLASASQDKYIRLWRFQQSTQHKYNGLADLIIAAERKSLSNKAHQVGCAGHKHSVTFEALLIGHEDWIYTARWSPVIENGAAVALLSASADNSLAVWQADAASGLWVCNSRLGEISSQKGSTTATGSTGGFWIGLWHPQCSSVVSLGRTGSWRKWKYDRASDMWLQTIAVGGHTDEVRSLSWAPSGDYLLSTGPDQTTRQFAEWKREGVSSWHELSRPQIHGYDLNCIDTISEHQFISGADEKLLRVFNKPKAVDKLLSMLSGTESSPADNLPDAANIPVLGLSNKAVVALGDDEAGDEAANGNSDDRAAVDPASTVHKSTLDLTHPPFEEYLARHTLWPEHEKLYGHGYEISAVAATKDGSLVATACKASSLDHAVIRLYDTTEWREIKPALTAHSLTVTSLAFSTNDNYLLSVGRDRQWCIFERTTTASKAYVLHTSNPKGHSRMILDCTWAPRPIGHVFATAGRDKMVKIWKLQDGKADCIATLTSAASVTAVAFSLEVEDGQLLLAHGNDEGQIQLTGLDVETFATKSIQEINGPLKPSKAVTSLCWRPALHEAQSRAQRKQFAAASDDGSIRIYNLW